MTRARKPSSDNLEVLRHQWVETSLGCGGEMERARSVLFNGHRLLLLERDEIRARQSLDEMAPVLRRSRRCY